MNIQEKINSLKNAQKLQQDRLKEKGIHVSFDSIHSFNQNNDLTSFKKTDNFIRKSVELAKNAFNRNSWLGALL